MVFHGHGRVDSAARAEFSHQRKSPGLSDGDEVVGNSVRDIFVEDSFVAKLLQVELQALQFDAQSIRHVSKRKLTKIGLSRFWADGREFGTNVFDHVISLWMRILEYFERFTKCVHVFPTPVPIDIILP
jgi:hypothetical protein